MTSSGGVELKNIKYMNGSSANGNVSKTEEPLSIGNGKEDEKKDGEEEKKDEPKRIATLKELFRTATCLDVFLMILGSLAAAAHGGGWPVMMIFFGDMTNQFVSGPGGNLNVSALNQSEIDELMDHFNDEMTKYALYYIYVGITVFAASFIQSTCWAISCERQIQRIRKQFFAAILKQEIGWFDVHQSGELTSRLSGDLTKVKEGMGDKLSFSIQFTAAFFSGYIIGFWKGWKLTLVMLSVAPLLAIMAALMSRLMASFGKREAESYAKAGSVAEEVLSCIRTVTSFNGQNQDMKRYDKTLQESVVLGQKKSWYNGFLIGFTMFCMFGSYALALWFGSEEAIKYNEDPDTGISPGTVLTVFFCVLVGTFSIGNISPHLASVAEARGAAGALIEIIDNVPSIDSSSDKGKRLNTVRGEIQFRNVHFRYPTREDVPVLQGVTMTVQPGQTVALVGPSGCGKSTTVNLIQRFYDTESGDVFIDGENVRDLNVKSLRSHIGVVSQEPSLFGLSIKENIQLGRPDATHEEIIGAAQSANCHDFIMKLPKQYDTLVGERGAQLSGGQKQRVAIARALIRDPKILLLDEATSALDTASERVVQAALDKARQGRTTIVIAHRLSTIKNADAIYVVQDGRIVETGRHAELMAAQGEYYQLVTVQSIVEEERGEEDVDDEEAVDVINDIKRKRTLSGGGKTERSDSKLGRQLSKQISRQTSKPGIDEKVEDEEKETAGKAGWFAMMRENSPECSFIIMGCCAAAINGCTMPAFSIFFGEMIQVFVDNGKNNILWSMMFLALGATQLLTNIVQHVSFGYSGMRLTKRLRQKTFKAYLRQDIAYFDDPKHSTGALNTRLSTDAAIIHTATGIRLAIIIQSMFSLVAALFIAFYYGWQLALVVLGAVPLMAIAGAVQLKTVMATHKKDNVELEKAGKTSSEAVDNIRTVQALTREPTFFRKYSNFLEDPYRTALRMSFVTGLTYAFSQGVMFLLYGGCFRFGAYMISKGEMDSSGVFKVFFAISMTALVMGQSASFLPEYSKASVAAAIIFKTVLTIPPIDVFSKKGQWPQKLAGSVTFKNVCFNYPFRSDVAVLKGIDLKVEPGQTIALVGPSGCGKSTVVSLLQRYYDPNSGTIGINLEVEPGQTVTLVDPSGCGKSTVVSLLQRYYNPNSGTIEVDGSDIRDINLVRLRYLISVVSQEPILFDTSIKENITYGLDSPIGMDEIIQAARAANIHEFISNLPMGYDTEVGEKGTQLSGGQKQRVAIARALVRNPRILLLDEATSALDTESEKLVQAALDNAQEGRTCIVIAHRLSTIQNADVIYVVDAGSIVEYGNHQQLLNKRGVYAQLVSGQQLS